jgi:uncharacterized membrane protein
MEENMNTTTNFRTMRMVQLALFTAIIILMAFTPIGYIRTPALSISLIVIPVTVGAIVLGPTSGAILGGVFGITSFIQCFGIDPFGVALLGINPILTFILCLVPRILMGWLSGILFVLLKKVDKTKVFSYAVTCFTGSLLNTILFMSTLVLFFYNTDFIQGMVSTTGATNALTFVIALVSFNFLIEAGVNLVAGGAVSKALDIFAKRG